ncbi:MAG: peptidoglycan DD-metalloendopeptidase family protein [Gallionella sp.]|nr:peptidoglycan DD-metalloendopeptidase family protein [Gallionella sp.]
MTLPLRSLIALLCFIGMLGNAYADKQQELENLRSRIVTLQKEIEKTRESREEIADSLRESERAISDSSRALGHLESQRREADQRLSHLRQQQTKLSSSQEQQQLMLGKLLYQQYLAGGQQHLQLLLSGRDPGQIARDLNYYEYIARERAALLSNLRTTLVELRSVDTETREKRTQLAQLQKEYAQHKAALEKEQRTRQQVLQSISQKLKQQRKEVTRLQRDENRLTQLVEKIGKMLAKPKSKSLFRNDNLPDNRYAGQPFEQLRGKLTLPVRGEVANRFGAPREESTVSWKGLFVRSPSGQPVKSIAAGRVVFADWLRGFGNLLIVDHGSGYMSLYGNNEALHKQVGDELRGGETVASVGNSGGNEDSGLYFELRHESKPLDPAKWLATK